MNRKSAGPERERKRKERDRLARLLTDPARQPPPAGFRMLVERTPAGQMCELVEENMTADEEAKRRRMMRARLDEGFPFPRLAGP